MVEKINFGQFDSEQLGLILTERSAPLPAEKRIVEDIPFSDGTQDYSQIFGKFFSEREITYTFVKINVNYEEKKALEANMKQIASPYGYQELYDTHDEGYYFKAKLTAMSFVNDPQNASVTCQLAFNAQPYMYRNNDSYDDVWDVFDFEVDVAQFYDYLVKGEVKATVIIPEGQKVEPTFELVSGGVTAIVNGYKKVLKQGLNATPFIVFNQVRNEFELIGNGEVKLHYDRKEMR